MGMLIISVIVLATIGIFVADIVFSCKDPNYEDFKMTTQTLIPLWGTWVGIVLAFYYGKSNFDQVTASYKKVIDKLSPNEKLAQMSIDKVMIPFQRMEVMDYEEALDQTLGAILASKKFEKYSRFAFVDSHQILRKMIHRKNLTQYITDQIGEGNSNPLAITFAQFLEDSENATADQKTKWGFQSVFIPECSNMLDAKRAIFSIPHNRDVFVTQNGLPDEAIIGLVTDEDILREMGRM